MNRFLFITTIAAFGLFASCGSQQQPTEDTVPSLSVEDLEVPATLALRIEGMACPNGCAKPIENGCAKLSGMAISKVNFANGTGHFTYDAALLTEKEIIACIENTNGGGLYKVTEVEVQAPNTNEEEELFEAAPDSGEEDGVNA